jgi:hypothetical protein
MTNDKWPLTYELYSSRSLGIVMWQEEIGVKTASYSHTRWAQDERPG